VYTRKRERLWEIGRPRYFEIAIIPMDRMIRYVDGWYALETAGEVTWRWMKRQSLTRLPAGRGDLDLHVYLPRATTFTVTWNGKVVESVERPEGEVELRYHLASRSGAANELRLEVASPANAPGDPRELGAMLKSIAWK
ncbi:MAG TPA: hypothetical protein VN181_13005, partial [Thermoanaerobaculia bacterium]|nr:hypothetical protein [Thermoanaerobaculia bacterium]